MNSLVTLTGAISDTRQVICADGYEVDSASVDPGTTSYQTTCVVPSWSPKWDCSGKLAFWESILTYFQQTRDVDPNAGLLLFNAMFFDSVS